MSTELTNRPVKYRMSSLELGKIDAMRPAGEQIYQVLRDGILSMVLPPGCALSEAEIGAKIGASRTPVREALFRLREDGLVITLPSRGNFVAKLSRRRITEAQFLREALELANVRHLAVVGMSSGCERKLTNNIKAQRAAVVADDHSAFFKLDDEFHLMIASATGHPRAAMVLDREKIQLDRLRAISLHRAGHLQALLQEHELIYAAVLNRNEPEALAATRDHVRTILDVLADLSERNSEYFE